MPEQTTKVVAAAPMNVRKRNGQLEPMNLEKISKAIARCAEGITDVDPSRVAIKTIGGLFDEVTTKDLGLLHIEIAKESVEHITRSHHPGGMY